MKSFYIVIPVIMLLLNSCNNKSKKESDDFKYQIDQFADLKVMRYQVPGFDKLSLKQKKLVYFLSQAALCGRDIVWDQNYKYNLLIRKTLEEIFKNYTGDRDNIDFKNFIIYLKRVWFSNGIHHHYASDKLQPGFTREYFAELINHSPNAEFPNIFNSKKNLIDSITPMLFNPDIASKKVFQNPGEDMITNSSVNFYDGINQEEAEAYYDRLIDKKDSTPVSFGLNSKLVKEKGKILERVWKLGGMYTSAIEKIIYWLGKAKEVAENDMQKKTIECLIAFYQSGDLSKFDEYNISWVKDTSSFIDFVNGFIEVYNDPLGRKATWEALVDFKDLEASKRTEILSNNAQWFEDHSPINIKFRKKNVKGISAKVITTAMLGGDMYPYTAIGVNLPNSEWIRKDYGSKSVTLENITYSYHQVSLTSGMLEEFEHSEKIRERIKKYGYLADNLQTDLHECLGHGSGQLLTGVNVDVLKNYYSTIEEARADLFALYNLMDSKMVELGLIPNLDAAKAEYDGYIRNGLMTQMVRIEPGKNIEEAHMRNRQLICKWCYEMGNTDNVIEFYKSRGKTYVKINDYLKVRKLFGNLLAEIQRIKSEGDYNAGKNLIENYGVKIDEPLHLEILERYKKLNLAPYGGFINPVYTPKMKGDEIIDIEIQYPDDYTKQMLYYSENYSFLPFYN